MALDDFVTGTSAESDLATRIREKIVERTRFDCRQPAAEGLSGNEWELDGVILDEQRTPKGYFLVPEIPPTPTVGEYETELREAFVIAAEFRREDVPGGVIVPEKLDTGARDWEALFESVDCQLLSETELDAFIDNWSRSASSHP